MSHRSHAPRHHPSGTRHRQAGHETRQGFTLGHAGRQVRIGPVAFWTIVGTLVIMATWTVATATYFAFQDDLLGRLIARHAEMQFAYEDRIADLRAQVDRLASRQLLDQEQYEQKLDQIARRQSMLESRAASLASTDPMPTGSIRVNGRSGLGERSALPQAPDRKTAGIGDTILLAPPPDREARLESRRPNSFATLELKGRASGLDGILAGLQASLDRVESTQTATLNALEESYESKARRMRGVLADLGVEAAKTLPKSAAVGGPFVPIKTGHETAFERQLTRVKAARAQFERISRALVTVPLRRPIAGEVETTSGFGMRLDPFLRAPAMHTGLDFRADTGDPVRATAAGTVVHAGPNGGYGKMVEIDHGNGITTRYAHLSSIEVETGQTIRISQIVGRVGSTGRSTGPHLHYETRIDGDAVDPQKFLRAGLRLGGLL